MKQSEWASYLPNRRNPDAVGRTSNYVDSVELPGLEDLPWELPHTFLGLDEITGGFAKASCVVLPVPYEATTSWGAGARLGPRAIIEASRYVELYDQEFDCEPAQFLGIHTLPALELSRAGPTTAMMELRSAYARIARVCGERFLVMLGGEHSISSAAVLAQADRHEEKITVLQLDAHADLRSHYEGTADSHASAMARVLDRADVVAVGVRGLSSEEVMTSRSREGSTLIWADEMWEGDEWMDRAIDALGPKVYLTIDVDYFNPALVPSTGTPEPGGLSWYKTLRFLRRVLVEREVIAADVVELAPAPGVHAPDFLVAKLVYKLINYRFWNRMP